MKRTARIFFLSGAASLLALAPTPGWAQQPAAAGNELDTLEADHRDAAIRLSAEMSRDGPTGPRTGYCDPVEYQAELDELARVARELQRVAAAARAAGEFSTVNAGRAERMRTGAQRNLEYWGSRLLECQERSSLRTGSEAPPSPPPPVPPAPDASAAPASTPAPRTWADASAEVEQRQSRGASGSPVPPQTSPAPDEVESILDQLEPTRSLDGHGDPDPAAPDASAPPASGPAVAPGATGSVGSSGSPAPPPVQPRADRSTLIVLRGALRRAVEICDRAGYEAAKERLLNLFDRLIADETDLERRQDLFRQRGEASSQRFPEPCPPESNANAGDDLGFYWDARLDADFGRADIPQTGTGVTRSGPPGEAPETDAGFTKNRVDTIGIGGSLDFGGIRVRGSYSDGDASTSFGAEPISGGFNGVVYGGLSPSGSSGIGAGSVALTGAAEVDLSRFRLGADVFVAQPIPSTRLYLSFDYFRDQRTHLLSQTGTVESGSSSIEFTQVRDQRIRDNALEIGIGAETRLPLNAPSDGGAELSLRIITAAQGYLLDSNLRSTERNLSNFGPSADRDFTIDIDQGETDFGVAAQAGAELNLAVSPGFAIFLGGSVEFRSRVGGVLNPNSGDQVFFEGRTTELDNDDSWSYGASIGIRVGLR